MVQSCQAGFYRFHNIYKYIEDSSQVICFTNSLKLEDKSVFLAILQEVNGHFNSIHKHKHYEGSGQSIKITFRIIYVKTKT